MSTATADPRLWICVHGHYYQPPRESPWLDEIEPQPSAAPYRDWNERITAECYRPNSAARVLDERGQITQIFDNYRRTSWNFGPTLLTYLQRNAPDVHDAIVTADGASCERFSGHGSALAQAHSHLILPLCSPRDRRTQIRWGAADFEHRFGRRPEGMWLPECAVDVPTLEALADEGLGFTVLAPRQARAFRPPGGQWQEGAIDTRRGYRCPLPSGRSVDLYFYDGALAQSVAFEQLLRDGRDLARRLAALPALPGGEPSLSHIATDGESYGHHHRFGEMALAAALASIEADPRLRLTNYAELRALHPPTWEVRIVEPSSWSCSHGVARWTDDCGCNTGAPGVHQRWRRPLREALDWLRDKVHDTIERRGQALFVDPWRARDAYISVLLGEGSTSARAAFFAAELRPEVAHEPVAQGRALSLMELGRAAMLMYTSCGWFFDDISGLETAQILRYAARAVELHQRLTGEDLEADLVERLARAPGNHLDRPQLVSGAAVWRHQVASHRIDLPRIARHVAVAAVVTEESEAVPYGTICEVASRRELRAEKVQLVSGTIRLRARWLDEGFEMSFACLRRGSEVVGRLGSAESLHALVRELGRWLDRPDAALAMMSAHAGAELELGCLLPLATRWVEEVFAAPLEDLERTVGELYERHLALAQWLVKQQVPSPEALAQVMRLALRRRLVSALAAEPVDAATAESCLDLAGQLRVSLDTPSIALAASRGLARAVEAANRARGEPALVAESLERAARIADTVARMRSPVDLWRAQNLVFQLVHGARPGPPVSHDAAQAEAWLARLAGSVGVALPPGARRGA